MKETALLDPASLKNLFLRSGALLNGHFLLSSGLHSGEYLQCALLLALPEQAALIGEALARLAPGKPDLVLSPAMGGLIIGHEVARALGARAYFAERENGAMALRRGFALRPGEKVIVVEDVITTGGSSKEVVGLARSQGADVVGILAIVDRSASAPQPGAPLKSLLKMPIASFRPEACPLCRQGRPVAKPGSRKAPKC